MEINIREARAKDTPEIVTIALGSCFYNGRSFSLLIKFFMFRIFRVVFFAALIIIITSPFLSGCSAPCTYPDQRGVKIRVLNAMTDMPVITVFINGKLFVQNFTYDPPADFGYLETYKDGSALSAGDSLLFVVTSDATGKDTLVSHRVSINFNRQTVIVMGRGNWKPPQPKTARIIRLDDEIDQPDPTHTLIRFVDACPDLDSIDIYFKGDTIGKPLGNPNATIRYSEIQSHIILNSVTGLTITEAGNPKNVIFSIGYPFAFPGFYITAVVRGASKPIGTEFTAAPLVLSDASIGNFIFNFKSFAVRLVNASRNQQLNLLIRSTYITLNNENTNPPRNNYPNQTKVLNINAATISDYLPLLMSNDSIAGYWLSKTTDSSGTVASSIDNAQANFRYSKIAVQENLVGSPDNFSYLSLADTMTNPSGNSGRVRVINLSPDHNSITVTLGGTTIVLTKKQVAFFDVPISNPKITVKDGSTTQNYTIPVSAITPISVYLLPEQSANPALPIATSND